MLLCYEILYFSGAIMLAWTSILFSFLFSSVAVAEENVIYKEKTEVDFEAVDVEGQLKKPAGDLIMSRSNVVFNPLLPPRLHFNQEMMQSINDVK